MDSKDLIQPWKQNAAVMELIAARRTEPPSSTQPLKGRANLWPQGTMMFNGGQSPGAQVVTDDAEARRKGGRTKRIFYDTERPSAPKE
jgi:hypothetical protein